MESSFFQTTYLNYEKMNQPQKVVSSCCCWWNDRNKHNWFTSIFMFLNTWQSPKHLLLLQTSLVVVFFHPHLKFSRPWRCMWKLSFLLLITTSRLLLLHPPPKIFASKHISVDQSTYYPSLLHSYQFFYILPSHLLKILPSWLVLVLSPSAPVIIQCLLNI